MRYQIQGPFRTAGRVTVDLFNLVFIVLIIWALAAL
jgi:hypothetical protein